MQSVAFPYDPQNDIRALRQEVSEMRAAIVELKERYLFLAVAVTQLTDAEPTPQ